MSKTKREKSCVEFADHVVESEKSLFTNPELKTSLQSSFSLDVSLELVSKIKCVNKTSVMI